jgi:hypothetical protein
MNRELAEHISLLAAPIYAALIATGIPGAAGEQTARADDWHLMAQGIAIRRALELWRETLSGNPP